MNQGDRDERLLDGLHASYGRLETLAAVLDERIKSTEADVTEVRAEHRQQVQEIKKAVAKTGEACERKIKAVEDKVDALREARRWGPAQWTAIITGMMASIGTILAVVLTRAPS